MNTALLPTGLGDLLPPEAELEARTVNALMDHLRLFGYRRVKPPLAEFEDTLLAHGPGQSLSRQSFRLMDPSTDRMMALRADMTPQIGRIASTRLTGEPRPLRLCYTGEILKTRGTQMRPERQYCQAGCELIGSLQPAADAEVIAVAAEGLFQAGVPELTIDLCVPTLVPGIGTAFGLETLQLQKLRDAVDRRDATALKSLPGPATDIVLALMETTGRATEALARIEALNLPETVKADIRRLRTVCDMLKDMLPDGTTLTIDPVEQRGFEYQTGLSFTFLSRQSKAALGRGGRYRTGANEPATGFTLYLPSILAALPVPAAEAVQTVLAGTSWAEIRKRQKTGTIVVVALPEEK